MTRIVVRKCFLLVRKSSSTPQIWMSGTNSSGILCSTRHYSSHTTSMIVLNALSPLCWIMVPQKENLSVLSLVTVTVEANSNT
ncbi:TPA: hypothetical protein N0F65_000821 [Lagenidium giganteum]|uniref:Uncharacterized protein n=1 Tax=Lagenidium giganteum TaxID=4803 RepID=A0AAV2YWE4_9STRA|nr:TPA: hypothetical protein N0F65_000821 [Lagenidium giganteum]